MKYPYIEAWNSYLRNECGMEHITNKYMRYQIGDAYTTFAPLDAVHKKLNFSMDWENPKWEGEWVTVRDLIQMNIWDLSNPSLQSFLAYAANRIQQRRRDKVGTTVFERAKEFFIRVLDQLEAEHLEDNSEPVPAPTYLKIVRPTLDQSANN